MGLAWLWMNNFLHPDVNISFAEINKNLIAAVMEKPCESSLLSLILSQSSNVLKCI